MSMYEERKIIITLDPDELRRLADKMERDFPHKRLGQSTFIDLLGHSSDLTVCLHADQTWFENKKKNKLTKRLTRSELVSDRRESRWLDWRNYEKPNV